MLHSSTTRSTFPPRPRSPVQPTDEGGLNVFSQKHNKWHGFKFDAVFGEASTQEEVYAQTQPLIRSVLDGGLIGAGLGGRVFVGRACQGVGAARVACVQCMHACFAGG